MRHKVHTFKIGRTSAHRRAMMANMISSLIEHGQITTTLVKAKEARRVADKMVTLAKENTVHHRRLAVARLHDKSAVKKLFDEIAPGFAEREGGYTRIYKLGKRIGDAAEMCIIQWVEAGKVTKKNVTKNAIVDPAMAVKKVEEAPKAEEAVAEETVAEEAAAE